MTRLPEYPSTSSWLRLLRRVWPQVPLGLFLFFVGAVNVLAGTQSRAFSPVYQILAQAIHLSELSQEVSLGILGSSVQMLLGTGLILTGIGLLWRLRSAWAFSILLLLIAIILDLFSQRDFFGAILASLALVALLIWQSRFSRRSLIGGYLMSLIGLLAVLAYGVFGSMLLGNSFTPNIHDIFTALYFTVVSLSTVGSNIYPATPEAQIFMVTLILGGISIFTTTIVTTLGPLLSNQIRPILSGKRARIRKHQEAILIGSSPFAGYLVQELAKLEMHFVQVVAPKDKRPINKWPTIEGDACNEDVLKQARISSATAVIVMGNSTAKIILSARCAKQMNPNAQVIVVAESPEDDVKLRSALMDPVFAPGVAGAQLLAAMIAGKSIPKEFQNIMTDGANY
jgi:voltage-gated potassium channel